MKYGKGTVKAAATWLHKHLGDDAEFWQFGKYEQYKDKWVQTQAPEWDGTDEMLVAKAIELGYVPPRDNYKPTTPEEVAEEVADRLRGGPRKKIRETAADFGMSYDDLMYHCEKYLNSGGDYYASEGGRFEGMSLPDEFWSWYELVTGRHVPANMRYSFFSCSC